MRIECAVCAKEFEAQRRSAKYCSGACRAYAFRQRRRQARERGLASKLRRWLRGVT